MEKLLINRKIHARVRYCTAIVITIDKCMLTKADRFISLSLAQVIVSVIDNLLAGLTRRRRPCQNNNAGERHWHRRHWIVHPRLGAIRWALEDLHRRLWLCDPL